MAGGLSPIGFGAPAPVGFGGGGAQPGDIRFFLKDPGAGWLLCDGTLVRPTPAALRGTALDGTGFEATTSLPDMTGRDVPAGYYVNESSYYSTAWDGFNSFDSNIGEAWTSSGNGEQWLELILPSPIWVGGIAVTAVPSSISDMPRAFYVEGFNSTAGNYEIILSVGSLAAWASRERRVFPIPNTQRQYRYLRWRAYAGSPGTYVRAGRIEYLKDFTGLQLPTIATTTAGAKAYMKVA